MANDEGVRLTAKETEITGKRYCSSCNAHVRIEGGQWVFFAYGRKKRWKCVGCVKRTEERTKWNWMNGDVNEQRE